MDAPISHFLERFTEAPAQIVGGEQAVAKETITLEISELEARVEAARLEAGRVSEAARAAELAQLRDDHRDALARAAADAEELRSLENGGMVAGLIDEAFAALHGAIAREIADALRPLLAEALAEQARSAVLQALEQILVDPDHPTIVVKGPAAFIEALRARRADEASLAYVVDETIDVTVVAGATKIETRLGAALTTLFEKSAHG